MKCVNKKKRYSNPQIKPHKKQMKVFKINKPIQISCNYIKSCTKVINTKKKRYTNGQIKLYIKKKKSA